MAHYLPKIIQHTHGKSEVYKGNADISAWVNGHGFTTLDRN